MQRGASSNTGVNAPMSGPKSRKQKHRAYLERNGTMGYVYAMGHCYCCKAIFCFNPHKVPSISTETGKEPICLNCMMIVNAKREANGVPAFSINEDAYEALPEDEL